MPHLLIFRSAFFRVKNESTAADCKWPFFSAHSPPLRETIRSRSKNCLGGQKLSIERKFTIC